MGKKVSKIIGKEKVSNTLTEIKNGNFNQHHVKRFVSITCYEYVNQNVCVAKRKT